MFATDDLANETNTIANWLGSVKNIAIVGISKNPTKVSYFVGKYLKKAGYTIFPVNPTADEILGEKCYASLGDIPVKIDVVNGFRRPEDIPTVFEEAINLSPSAIWLQLGTGTHPELDKRSKELGITFVQKRCIKADHQFLIRDKS